MHSLSTDSYGFHHRSGPIRFEDVPPNLKHL